MLERKANRLHLLGGAFLSEETPIALSFCTTLYRGHLHQRDTNFVPTTNSLYNICISYHYWRDTSISGDTCPVPTGVPRIKVPSYGSRTEFSILTLTFHKSYFGLDWSLFPCEEGRMSIINRGDCWERNLASYPNQDPTYWPASRQCFPLSIIYVYKT